MLIFVLITVGKRVDFGGQEQAKEGKQKEGDLGEDSSEGTTSGKCTDGGGKEPAATDTGKDGDLVEGSSKETTNEPMQEEESRYAADAHLKAAKLVRVAFRARRASSHCSPPGNAWIVRSHTTSCALMRPTRKV